MSRIPLLASVALIEDLPGKKLTKGQIGTVVEYLEREGEEALLVEFSDTEGRTFAMVDLKPDQLIVLHQTTEAAWAKSFSDSVFPRKALRPIGADERRSNG